MLSLSSVSLLHWHISSRALQFFDKERGDIILNPLDERCPYWGPAQEMASNAEADAIAASLYQPATDAKDEFFHQTPHRFSPIY